MDAERRGFLAQCAAVLAALPFVGKVFASPSKPKVIEGFGAKVKFASTGSVGSVRPQPGQWLCFTDGLQVISDPFCPMRKVGELNDDVVTTVWHSVDDVDKLPVRDNQIVAFGSCSRAVLVYSTLHGVLETKRWQFDDGRSDWGVGGTVTHWAELPEGPFGPRVETALERAYLEKVPNGAVCGVFSDSMSEPIMFNRYGERV